MIRSAESDSIENVCLNQKKLDKCRKFEDPCADNNNNTFVKPKRSRKLARKTTECSSSICDHILNDLPIENTKFNHPNGKKDLNDLNQSKNDFSGHRKLNHEIQTQLQVDYENLIIDKYESELNETKSIKPIRVCPMPKVIYLNYNNCFMFF